MFTRFRIFEGIIYLSLFLLLCGFFRIQILKGSELKLQSENNRIRTIPIISARGRIYDRDRNVLADNKPIFNFHVIAEDFNLEYIPKVASIIDVEESWLRKRISKLQNSHRSSQPVIIKTNITEASVYRLEELSTLVGGIVITNDSLRFYPEGDLAAHILGYIGKITKEEYLNNKHRGWLYNDYIGRAGIERTFNEQLMGIPGGKQVEVNALGKQIRVLSQREPEIGSDVQLTIDAEFQKKIMNHIDTEKQMSVCVLDVKTGEILALVSTPSFDPNVFLQKDKSKERLEYLNDKRRPITNRPVTFAYPPGSVWKLLVAVACLEEEIITPQTHHFCTGSYKINPRSRAFKCWKEGGHGDITLYTAIEQSCNTFFYRYGLELGSAKIAKYAKMFGFGKQIELGLPFSRKGLVPDALWKLKKFNEKWYSGETLNYSIGQGFLQVTPLQVARMVAAIAMDGKLIEPNIIKGRRPLSEDLPIKRKYFSILQKCMLLAIESSHGTAQLAKPSFLKMAGKTGTAQTVGESHSWYAGFFPYHNPDIALVVMVEHGGSGGGTAAIYAGRIADEWLLHKEQKESFKPMTIDELTALR